MRIVSLAFAVAFVAVPASAAEPNDQDCKQLISGTWTTKPGDGGKAVSVTYQPDGVYRQDGGSSDAGHVEETGAWFAETAAGTGACNLTLTPTGGEPRSFSLTMVDHNTVKAEDGTISTRTEGTMEGHTSP